MCLAEAHSVLLHDTLALWGEPTAVACQSNITRPGTGGSVQLVPSLIDDNNYNLVNSK
jgi:hypothetical protein